MPHTSHEKNIICTYTDIVPFKWKSFYRWCFTWNKSEYFVVAPVPLDGVQSLILQGEGALKQWALTLLDRGRDVDPQVTQATSRN